MAEIRAVVEEHQRRKSPPVKGHSAATVLEAARMYTKRGERVVPIPPAQKGPRLRSWQNLRLTESELPRHFSDNSNIGIILGDASDGLVDVDLDSIEAIAASSLLPPTDRCHGRKSSPGSHRWYKTTPSHRPVKFTDLDGACLVELRSTGQQTLVPPSVHPSGERIIWERGGEAATVDSRELRIAVARVATVALIARHWPTQGSRHETSLALAGFLLRAGWDEKLAKPFIELVAKAANDEGFRYQVADAGFATGQTRLAQLIGKEVVAKAAQWLGIHVAEEEHQGRNRPNENPRQDDGGVVESPSGSIDFSFVRKNIPIAQVCQQLGIEVMPDGRRARCWRADGHRNGDRDPSMRFWISRNKVHCFVCDQHAMSNLDVVMAFRRCSLVEAARWIARRFDISRTGPGKHIDDKHSWNAAYRVGTNGSRLEHLVRSGFFAELSQPQQAILVTLVSFSDETNTVQISYRGIVRFSGVRSHASVSEALHLFRRIGLLFVQKNVENGYRSVNRYHLQFENERFIDLLKRTHERVEEEIAAERRLRAEERSRRTKREEPVRNPLPV